MSSEYIQALKIGSGLDTNNIVDAIIDARRVTKETQLNDRIEEREVKISTFGEIKSSLSSLETNLGLYDGITGLKIDQNGTSFTASITDQGAASNFSHSLEVSSLATSQTLVFDGYSSADTALGTGSLAIAFGTWSGSSFTANGTSSTVAITSGNDTLEGIAAKVNDAAIGVTASVVMKSTGNYALVFQATTGASNAMQITVTEDNSSSSLDGLNYTTYSATTQTVAGADAALTIDGVGITRTSNTITDLIDGVTLSLTSKTTSAETVSAVFDQDTAMVAAQGFVAELNAVISSLNTQYSRGTGVGDGGNLPGDPLVRSMISQIRSIITTGITGFGASDIYLANFGVMTNRDGSISLDTDVFKAKYAANPDSFNALLNSRVTTGSQLVTGTMTGDAYVAGSYAFTVSGTTATIDSGSMTYDSSNKVFYTNSGNAAGVRMEISGSGTNTTTYIGRSALEKLTDFTKKALAYGNDIDDRITTYNTEITDYTTTLADFEDKIASLRIQYVNQFAAMDRAVAGLDRTKETLNSMMESWKGSMSG